MIRQTLKLISRLTLRLILQHIPRAAATRAYKLLDAPRAAVYDAWREMETSDGHMNAGRAGTGDAAVTATTYVGRYFALISLFTMLLLSVRLWRLDASCLWFDEVFSVHAARHDSGGLLRFVALDLIHPPLFYLALKGWLALGGESVWWLRLFPALTATAAGVPLVLLCRELRLRPAVAQFALLLMCVNGFLIQHAQELRMYSLLLLCAACSLWLFARFIRADADATGRDALALFCVNLLLVYTHYFGGLLVGLELICVLLWRRRKLKVFASMCAALAVCYVPWLWMVLRAAGAGGAGLAQNIGWAQRPALAEIFRPFLLLHEPFRFRRNTYEPPVLRVNLLLACALFAPPLIAHVWRTLRRRRGDDAALNADAALLNEADERPLETAQVTGEGRHSATTQARPEAHHDGAQLPHDGARLALNFLCFFAIAPVVCTFLLALVLPQSIWGTRHLIIIAPAYLALAAAALLSLKPFWLGATVKLILACWLTLAAVFYIFRRDEPPVWCAWNTLAHRARQAESSSRHGTTSGVEQAATSEVKQGATHEVEQDATSEVKIYAFEDLVAYHLWYALSLEPGAQPQPHPWRVAVVKHVPGLAEDASFFLPRGFDEVTVTDADAAMREAHFWAAFRDTPALHDDTHPLLRLWQARGYDIAERYEVKAASGQTAYLVSLTRRAAPKR